MKSSVAAWTRAEVKVKKRVREHEARWLRYWIPEMILLDFLAGESVKSIGRQHKLGVKPIEAIIRHQVLVARKAADRA